ncbi:hypothetical protein BDZ90DRAFT_100193 [Jaminaea rosea]|uniref:Uncharacterized protein n=1 Tax=Jaminaea rosea TaxID=1569628 RepID=A0A316UH99_9BASI|nr:hypothetical protein BDZ90DRAFT_100193 [Jaminaea rosea]PWN24570.1 hypothetical protein BDZ90DRAFT_100193 [Jaminaea rosea]
MLGEGVGAANWQIQPPFDVVVTLDTADGEREQQSLRMPCQLCPNQSGDLSVSILNTVKLRAETRTAAPSTLPIPTSHAYLSHSHLSTTLPPSLNCSTCLQPLLIPPPSAKFIAMPSEHWEELIDSWMCHGDQRLNVSVTQGREGLEEGRRIAAGEGRVGDAWVAWDTSAVPDGAIIDLQEVSKGDKRCGMIRRKRAWHGVMDTKKVDVDSDRASACLEPIDGP